MRPVGTHLADVTSMALKHGRFGWYAIPHFGAQNQEQPPQRRYFALNQPGDILYVREPYWHGHPVDAQGNVQWGSTMTWYAADGENPTPYTAFINHRTGVLDTKRGKPFWTAGSAMPRHRARTYLLVTNVQLHRMRDLTDDEIRQQVCDILPDTPFRDGFAHSDTGEYLTIQQAWRSFCIKQFGQAAWERNDWCWVYTVELINRRKHGS